MATKVFPELAVEMIEVGESTGALPQMLKLRRGVLRGRTCRTKPYCRDEPDRAVDFSSSWVLVVVTILIALYLPIFSPERGRQLAGFGRSPWSCPMGRLHGGYCL